MQSNFSVIVVVAGKGGTIMKYKGLRLWSMITVLAILAAGGTLGSLEKQNKIIRQVPTTHKVVAFTFDDGPHPGTTPELLKVLREKGVKATFFILGRNAEVYGDLLKQVIADGHEIGNHGYSHQFLHQISLEQYLAEVERNELILAQVGVKPVFFRPPGGGYNDLLVNKLQEKGYTTVMWTVDTRDWSRPSVSQVVKTASENVKPGSIFLFHDGQDKMPTPQAVGQLIDQFRAQGYQFVTMSELLQYYEFRH